MLANDVILVSARFAVINNDVTVVTNSTDTFKQVCHLLEKEIHCTRDKAHTSDHQSGPNKVLFKSKLLELNMELNLSCLN